MGQGSLLLANIEVVSLRVLNYLFLNVSTTWVFIGAGPGTVPVHSSQYHAVCDVIRVCLNLIISHVFKNLYVPTVIEDRASTC